MRYFLFSLFVGVAFGFVLIGFQGGFDNYMNHSGLYQWDVLTSQTGQRAYPEDSFVRVDANTTSNTRVTVGIGRDIQSSGPREIDQPVDGCR